MNYRKQESPVPPDLLQVLLRPISEAAVVWLLAPDFN